ncbi:MAG: protein phosphatase 2C domain-containing protein [Acidobacteriaceae bacterium]|nr:protein phosphatase 2C domain-containing protein [Acidobacteriaceae bacterium]MBV8570215.1 protein phosphatase 2C domain-containing protein [Acidobacteriaceae bacterium]
MKTVVTWRTAAASDAGLHRQVNEDRVFIEEELGIFLVADGLGGHAAGEHAADIAVREIAAQLKPRPDIDLERNIRLAITAANNRIYNAAQANPDWKGMACVLTLAVIYEDQVTVGHVGDSRLYLFKDHLLRKLTLDHSPVGELEDSGQLTEEQAMRHPRRNEVFRDVGSTLRQPDDAAFIDIYAFTFPHDAALLLCSDGLSDVLTSAAIARILDQFDGDARRTTQLLIEAANHAGGKDNISAILIAGPEFAGRLPQSAAPARARHEITRIRDTRRGWPAWLKGLFWLALGFILGASAALAVAWWQRALFVPKSSPPHAAAPRHITVDATDSLGIIKALAIAAAGDTIEVPKGQYLGPLRIKEDVNLEGVAPGEAVVRSDPNSTSYPGVAIIADGIQRGRVRGLAVSGDDTHPLRVGMFIQNSSVEADELDISGAIEAGILIAGDSRPRLLANFLHNNSGPGALITDQSRPSLSGNTVTGNGTSPDASRPGIEISPTAQPVLTNNTVSDNGSDLKHGQGFKPRGKSRAPNTAEPAPQ